jgi:hypothetical protein
MFQDKNLLLHNTVITDGAQASTSYIDTLAAGDAISPVARLLILITTAMAGMTSVTFQLTTDSDSAFGTEVSLVSTGAVLTASLTIYKAYLLPIPLGVKRYLRGYITSTGGSYTAGAVKMQIVLDGDKTIDKIL